MLFKKKRGRRGGLKLPFLKIRINARTWINIIGFIFVGFGLLLYLSYIQSGDVLIKLNMYLLDLFGLLSFIFPLLAIFLGTHFFNSKKVKIIKPHITFGLALMFIALLATMRSGQVGFFIFDNLYQDFSGLGAYIIIFFTFIIGLILFLNTSLDSFLVFVITIIKTISKSSAHVLQKNTENSTKSIDKKDQKDEFIRDIRPTNPSPSIQPVTPTIQHPQTSTITPANLHIKPLSKQSQTDWKFPPVTMLSDISSGSADRGDVKRSSDIIEKTLDSFGIRARVSEVNMGPTVTQYAIEIAQGTKLSKITALSNDLALALAATTGQVRIEAPIPGRSLVGIEIPNQKAEIVSLKRMLSSPAMTGIQDPLLVPLGLDVSGIAQATSISRMPHVLIAGTTGSGKSVILNAWICSFLFRAKPEDLNLILVDPKRVELSLYNGLPHLLSEVIVEPDKIISALKWTVKEMETRYKTFAKIGVRNIEGYNTNPENEKMPYIVFVIDELADLMIFAAREAEELITRIAQMARATGIHLILATQRPSVDVITGLMKANIPTRIAFNVASMIDSRVVLDMPGAEKLLGKGDMLFLPPDQAKPRRIQGPYISEKDVTEVVSFLKKQTPVVHYTEEVTTQDTVVLAGGRISTASTGGDVDPLFNQAVEIVTQFGKASASLLQRRLSVGYARAAKILDQLEVQGFIGPAEGSKPRPLLQRPSQQQEQQDMPTE